MKTAQAPRTSSRAFTLIELLTVISIIAILASVSLVVAGIVIDRGRALAAKSTATSFASAVANYHEHYHRMPVKQQSADVTVELSAGEPLLRVLMGENVDRLNPGTQSFFEPAIGQHGANGLVGQDGAQSLADPWGTPYRVIMDADGDGLVANPDVDNQDPEISGDAPSRLPRGVLVLSAGKDQTFGTRDDVTSWRH